MSSSIDPKKLIIPEGGTGIQPAKLPSQLKFRIELLTCKTCSKKALALVAADGESGQRITGHKCSGSWHIEDTFTCTIDLEDFQQCLMKERK